MLACAPRNDPFVIMLACAPRKGPFVNFGVKVLESLKTNLGDGLHGRNAGGGGSFKWLRGWRRRGLRRWRGGG